MSLSRAQFAAVRKYLFVATQVALLKAEPRRFDRESAAGPLAADTEEWFVEGIEALLAHLEATDGFEAIRNHVAVQQPEVQKAGLEKALTDADRALIERLLAGLGYLEDSPKRAAELMAEHPVATFEAAAEHALTNLGLAGIDFELKNPAILEALRGRSSAAIFAGRNGIDDAMDTIVRNFFDLGSNPFDDALLADLEKSLKFDARWKAKRFALTETGISAETAQIETYRRNGVERKRWNINGVNTRASHQALNGVIKTTGEKFDVGGNPGDHPLDPALPAEEIVNCKCWLSPVIDDEFEIAPESVWRGE